MLDVSVCVGTGPATGFFHSSISLLLLMSFLPLKGNLLKYPKIFSKLKFYYMSSVSA